MAVEQAVQLITVPAGSDLSAKQFYFVDVNSSSQLAVCGTGLPGIGVLQDKPAAAARPGAVAISGKVKVAVGGTVTAGQYVSADSTGRAVNAVSGDFAMGRAITGATVAGTIVEIVLLPGLGKVW